MNLRISLLLSSAVVLSAAILQGADLAVYRSFHLGMPVIEVAKEANLGTSDVQLIASRPARIEQLDWHVNWVPHSAAQATPFSELLFRFYNGALFEMAVTYDRDQTRGLTDGDMIEAVSGVYGPPAQPVTEEVSFGAGFTGSKLKVIARWEDSASQISLVHLSYGPGFGIVISSRASKTKAEQAIAESERLDRAEAPQRELALRARQLAETQAADEKARALNKAGFRP